MCNIKTAPKIRSGNGIRSWKTLLWGLGVVFTGGCGGLSSYPQGSLLRVGATDSAIRTLARSYGQISARQRLLKYPKIRCGRRHFIPYISTKRATEKVGPPLLPHRRTITIFYKRLKLYLVDMATGTIALDVNLPRDHLGRLLKHVGANLFKYANSTGRSFYGMEFIQSVACVGNELRLIRSQWGNDMPEFVEHLRLDMKGALIGTPVQIWRQNDGSLSAIRHQTGWYLAKAVKKPGIDIVLESYTDKGTHSPVRKFSCPRHLKCMVAGFARAGGNRLLLVTSEKDGAAKSYMKTRVAYHVWLVGGDGRKLLRKRLDSPYLKINRLKAAASGRAAWFLMHLSRKYLHEEVWLAHVPFDGSKPVLKKLSATDGYLTISRPVITRTGVHLFWFESARLHRGRVRGQIVYAQINRQNKLLQLSLRARQ